ncbi:efflux RND transporter periplasmic adaptor subunit [Ferrimonas senticii]|uniref:efflux RND transporter periplasmic adaptor subunit n=1 Tax=Ferrimonas senticii TaxID=394566 RepID=UPI00041AA2CF|nr:hypothetical protein [Ferrimonas senticii]
MKDKKRWLAVGLACGVAAIMVAKALKPGVEAAPEYDRSRLVDVVTLTTQQLLPEATGFGRVAPKQLWQAIAEVSGEVIYRHPDLYAGRLLAKGTELLKIDPTEYQLKLAQAQADLNAAKAQLTKIDRSVSNLNASLALELRKLKLTEQETTRKQQLRQQSLISSSELESQQSSLLSQRNGVQELQNQLALLPDDRAVAEAKLNVAEASVADAQRRLAKTVFTMPFSGRIGAVEIEQGEAISANQMLFEAHGIDVMEVQAQVPLHEFRTLAKGFKQQLIPGQFAVADLGLSATVEVTSGNFSGQWQAQVTGVREALDPNQATLGVTLDISQNYAQLDLRQTPPLVKEMFVRTTITGAPQTVLAVPARALRQSRLYLYEQGKLAITPVTVLFRSGDWVAVQGNIAAGQQVVLNDLIPAINGMALRLTKDAAP